MLFRSRELERQLKAVDALNKMVKDLSQITFESKMDKWLKASKAKEWVKLTREEKYSIYIECSNCFIREPTWEDFANAVEDKLKDKNT